MVAQLDKIYAQLRPIAVPRRLISYALFEGRPLTTRGRWINPFVMANLIIGKSLPAIKKVKQPIFIVGTGRSGTTVLGTILSIHRQVAFLNEPKAMWFSLYPNEDVNGNYTMLPARFRLNETDVTSKLKIRAHHLYGNYLLSTFSSRVVEKNQELLFRIPFIQEVFPDAKFIFLVRNGWNTCHSISNWSEKLGMHDGKHVYDWWGKDNRKWHFLLDQLVEPQSELYAIKNVAKELKRQTDMAAVEWIITMREGLLALAKNPEIISMVRYEDLISQPEGSLTNLIEFCDLPRDNSMIAYAEKILKPVPNHPRFDLHPALLPLFTETMSSLGYTTNG